MAIAFFGLNTSGPATADRPAADQAARASVELHGERVEHRPDRAGHDHQHRHGRDQRLVAGVHPARRADHHLGLERRPTHRASGQVTARPVTYNTTINPNSVGDASASRPPTPATRVSRPRSPSTETPARSHETRTGARRMPGPGFHSVTITGQAYHVGLEPERPPEPVVIGGVRTGQVPDRARTAFPQPRDGGLGERPADSLAPQRVHDVERVDATRPVLAADRPRRPAAR